MLLGLGGTAVLASAGPGMNAGGGGDPPIPALSAPSPVEALPHGPVLNNPVLNVPGPRDAVVNGPDPNARTGVEVSYDWPLPPGDVTRTFDQPDAPWLSGHRGVDLAGSAGVSVLAAADGVVAFAGMVAGKGVVSIDHADGIRTTYEPVISDLSAGTPVRRGDVIGTLTLGHGLATALHWGAKVGKDYLDPVTLIDAPVVIRLYPERPVGAD